MKTTVSKMKISFLKNKIGISLMILSSIFACIGQLLWKLSLGNINMFLILGFLLYGVGAFIMLVAYKFGSLSVLQPILSLNYILSMVLSSIVLNEPITLPRIVGVIIIMFGVLLIGGGDN